MAFHRVCHLRVGGTRRWQFCQWGGFSDALWNVVKRTVFAALAGTDSPAIPVAAAYGLQLLIAKLVSLFLGQGKDALGAFAGFRFFTLFRG